MISADVLGERARLTPDALALVVVDPPLRLAYHELDERAVRCAAAWRALGLGLGDRAAILAHNRVEYLDAFFAAGKSGVILVTLGTRLTAHELAPILADSGARIVLYDADFASTVGVLRESAASVERWVALDQRADPADASYAELVAASVPASFAPVRCDSEEVYCLLYTSGTTGRPKGVMIPHRQVAWNGYNTVCGWQLRADDVSPIFTPLYHAGGLMAFLVPIFTIGGTIVLHRTFDAGEIWRTIERERATVVLGVPTIWKLLAEAPEFASADLSSLRCLYSGGAPLPTWIAEIYQRRGLVFEQGFGMTEVGVNCFAMTIEDSVRKLGSIGKPMMHTEVRLVGADGRDVSAGEIGEMWFRGPHVSLGYWNRPDATAESYVEGGWFCSGDLARRDEDGFFFIAGRAKEMFISGGVNVYPAEIEAVLLQHPGVRDAAVVGIEHPTWGEVGIAFVVPLAEGSAEADSVLDFVAERLARFKLPKEIVHLDELPRTAYGKVVKGELRARYLAERGA
ncbi:MAG TPA: long-chain fatty acid--CoA ligase [Thermoanaerobaculia bacterium]|nr:long-chain fatty acid--CoA ligase [Thermoanaerobaculia bacterium]